MTETKKPSVWSKLADVLTLLILLVSVFAAVSAVLSRSTGVARFFGRSVFSVQTNSMEPTFQAGDLIIGRRVEKEETLKAGDVITYWTILDGHRVLNTHRIQEVQHYENGDYYVTKGDHPNAPVDEGTVTIHDVAAVYTGIRIPGLGKGMDFLTSQKGFFLCVLLPMLMLFLYQIYRFIQDYKAYVMEQAAQRAGDGLSAEEKRRIAEAYLAQHKLDQNHISDPQ